jgi:hypothetical protein
MTNESGRSLASTILFPQEVSDRIISTLLSPKEVSWSTIENLLDEIVPRVVNFGYRNIPGIRTRLDDAGIPPQNIADFESYEKLFPMISVSEMAAMDPERLQLQPVSRADGLRSHHYDCVVTTKYVLEYTLKEGGKKKRKVVKADVTTADARAACLAMAGQFQRLDELPSSILVNQKQEDYLGDDFLVKMVIPALELAGSHAERVSGKMARLAVGRDVGLLMPRSKNRILDVSNTSDFACVISTDGRYYPGKTLPIGDYFAIYGLFPSLGFRMPFPIFVRAIDSGRQVPRELSGEPDTGKRGRIVIDRFISAYEFPTPWKLLVDGLTQVLDYLELIGQETLDVKELKTFWDCHSNYGFRDEFHTVVMEAGLDEKLGLTVDDVYQLYSVALRHHFRRSIRIGVPNSTWLLKVGFPFAARIDDNGVVDSIINLSSDTSAAYAAGKDLPVKYPPKETPFLNHNIIGAISGGKACLPRLVPSAVRKRISDVLNGRNLFGEGKDGYLYSMPVIAPGDFDLMLRAAHAYSSPKGGSVSSGICLEDIIDILSRLHALVESELKAAYDRRSSIISIFAEKTRIPLSEIRGMVERARTDFIDRGGIGLKKMAYAAFIDPFADINSLSTKTLERGISALKGKKPLSPVFMVTPGNIILYDSFYILAHILMAKLSNHSRKPFTMYIRPSESDITFNFLVHHFHHIARELDPDNKKGLRTLIQRAYWDPRYDEDWLKRAMTMAEAGIYYGTAKTYMKARFRAALDVAAAKGFGDADIASLLEIAGRRQIEYRSTSLECALEEGVNPRLVDEVGAFLSRHKLYPETLNAIVLLPDAGRLGLPRCAESIIEQVISTRGTDCTNANKLWIHRSVYDEFMSAFEEEAGKLTFGDVMNPGTRLAQYDTHYLKGTQGIVRSNDDTRIIAPTNVATGQRASEPISPENNYTGVIVTEIEAETLMGGDPVDRDTYLTHLSKELPLPWLNIILYDKIDQVLSSMKGVLEKYTRRSGYPRYLYVSAMGAESVDAFEKAVNENGMADLFKKGEEAYSQFLYYRPHQGSFFINELVR